MVNVIFRQGVLHWESGEITALGCSVDALYRKDVWEYLGLTGREDIFIRSVDITKPVAIVEEAPAEEKPLPGITVLEVGVVRTVGYKRELLRYEVQFICDIKEVMHNIVFYVDMIWTKMYKSVDSISIELLQKVPAGMPVDQAGAMPGYSKPKKVLP